MTYRTNTKLTVENISGGGGGGIKCCIDVWKLKCVLHDQLTYDDQLFLREYNGYRKIKLILSIGSPINWYIF